MDQYGPGGSTVWLRNAAGMPTGQVTTLAPWQQRAFDTQSMLTAGVLDAGVDKYNQIHSNAFSVNDRSIPKAANYHHGELQRNRVEDAMWKRLQGKMDPYFAEEQRRKTQELANRGIPVSSRAHGKEWEFMAQRHRDARLAAAQDAILMGGQEQSRLFGLQDAMHQTGVRDALTERGTRLNELGTLLGFSRGTAIPSFIPQPTAGYASVDAAGIYNQQYQNAYNAYNDQANRRQSMIGSILGFAGDVAGGYLGGL